MKWIFIIVSYLVFVYWVYDYLKKFGFKYLVHDEKFGKAVL